MAESRPLVVVNAAGRRFSMGTAATDALKSATCTVSAGNRIVLIGPSGSGKSTLLHLLGGLDSPSFGSVEWPALGPKEDLRPAKVADIFQGPSLLTPLTVIENVSCLSCSPAWTAASDQMR